ncbi:hypothetical protein HA402_009654 [Bradysia odoriphaga]|nr:hypothetical protein HA402_009654 [Bradysia odoriphaga]
MIPLIDCAAIAEGDFEEVSLENYNKVAQEIGRAMTGIGMCNLINVGVSMEKIEKVYEVSKKFFELPIETKLKYRKVSPTKSFHGYSAPGDEFLNENAKNSTELREFWDIWGTEAYDEKMLPDDDVPGFKKAIDDVRSELESAGKKIFRCIELCLELKEGTFTSTHRNLGDRSIRTHSQLRSLYYYKLNPNANFPPNAIRCGEHKDWGSITFLIQDMVGGLEVKTSEGEWIPAVPVKNAILLNSGQLMEYWTGGRFHAANQHCPYLQEMIPLIDCAAIAEGDFEEVSLENYNKVAKEIGRAMTGIGMCNLINVGVSMEKIEKVYEVSKKFFELPVETKMKYRKVSPTKSFHGYSAPGDEFLNENAKNSTELREFWDIWGTEAYDEKMLPDDDVPGFKKAIDDVRSELESAGKKIFRCIELCLELKEGTFTSTHRNLGDRSIRTHSQLRSLYYYKLNPNANFPPNAIRCGEHKDWGSITFLIQDMVGGLEVKTSEGEWIPAVPVKNAILLNSGQLMEYWTGGRFHAAPHRVRIITEGKEAKDPRQSVVFFINPDNDTEVFPVVPVLPEKETQFQKFNNQPVNAYKFYQERMKNTSFY